MAFTGCGERGIHRWHVKWPDRRIFNRFMVRYIFAMAKTLTMSGCGGVAHVMRMTSAPVGVGRTGCVGIYSGLQ